MRGLRPPLIEPSAMLSMPGVQMPYAFYVVSEAPAPLAGMPIPTSSTPWQTFANAGFSQVVCLTDDVPHYDPTPLTVSHAVGLEDLFQGEPPREPEREEARIRAAVAAVLQQLQMGHGVIVHCYGGRGRAGTVIGCVLRELGYSGSEVCAYLDRLHKARWKSGWPEAAWQADLVARF